MKYIVPYDFTPIARTALNHAYQVSKSEPGEIILLHIVNNAEEKESAEKQFKELTNSLEADKAGNISTRIRIGDIFKDISREAEEAEADLLVMGTHGAKGLQKVFGSRAIKVITSSGIPFIITQDKEPESSTERIILPVDLSHEKVQIASFAANLAKKFSAAVHIVASPQSDEFLKNRLRNNITKVKRFLKKDGITHEVALLGGKKAFYKEVIEYGKQQGASMYAIAHHPQTIFPQLEKFSQELITNPDKIPVLIVNAKELVGVKANYAFIGI